MMDKLKSLKGFFYTLGDLSLVGCGGDDYLMEKVEMQVEGGWEENAINCRMAIRGGDTGNWSSTAEGAPEGTPYVDVEGHSEKGQMTVLLTGPDEEVSLEFDEEFLKSGEESVTKIMGFGDVEFRYTYWGGPDCASN